MSNDINTVTNLIDLSADDDVFSQQTVAPPSSGTHFTQIPLVPLSHTAGVESLVNNPFDCVQEQANRPHDPFEILSQEAAHQPHHSELAGPANQSEVRTENLLWISDDNIKLEESLQQAVSSQLPEFSKLQLPSRRFSEAISSVSSIGSGPFSPCDDSAFTSRNESSKTLNKAFLTDNTISSLSEDSRTKSLMNKGFVASCSSFDVSQSSGNCTPECASGMAENSDSSGKIRSQKAIGARTRLLKLSLSNSTTNSPLTRNFVGDIDNSSPLSSVFSEAEHLAENFSSRFILKSFDDSCDDIMSIKPNWVDSETDIDSDLEMMRIPILQEIPSPVVEKKCWEEAIPVDTPTSSMPCKNSPDFEALKEKVQQHRAENNNQEIGLLIDHLKQVITDCASETKKAEANTLLESLSNLLNDKNSVATENLAINQTPPPQPIVRQGTFDMELRQKEERERQEGQYELEEHCDDLQAEEEPYDEQNVSGGTHSISGGTHSISGGTHSLSGGTHSLSGGAHSIHSGGTHSVHSPDGVQSEVSDIVEQIGRILGNQNVNVVQANLSGSSGSGAPNPTYIVVMNTPIVPKQRPSVLPLESLNDGSPDLSQGPHRRRSQSLSLHDKSRQFTAPAPPSPLRNDCKTPARGYMVRRNSFSNATSSTPALQAMRRSVNPGASSSTDTATKNSQMPRRSMALETHHEKQQSVPHQPVPPIRMGGISFNAKKLKFKQSTESIVKACGPLKATIPVKKVAPMIVTTNMDSPIEDVCNMKSVTSTPNVHAHQNDGYPNACSTPMIETSPAKRSGMAKSRYSFVGATPTSKQSSLAPTTSHARRRTIGEMRSPKKVVAVDKTATGISKPAVKTVKLPQNYSKTLNKMAPTTSRGTLRLTKPSTTPAANATQKNKENKVPRTSR